MKSKMSKSWSLTLFLALIATITPFANELLEPYGIIITQDEIDHLLTLFGISVAGGAGVSAVKKHSERKNAPANNNGEVGSSQPPKKIYTKEYIEKTSSDLLHQQHPRQQDYRINSTYKPRAEYVYDTATQTSEAVSEISAKAAAAADAAADAKALASITADAKAQAKAQAKADQADTKQIIDMAVHAAVGKMKDIQQQPAPREMPQEFDVEALRPVDSYYRTNFTMDPQKGNVLPYGTKYLYIQFKDIRSFLNVQLFDPAGNFIMIAYAIDNHADYTFLQMDGRDGKPFPRGKYALRIRGDRGTSYDSGIQRDEFEIV